MQPLPTNRSVVAELQTVAAELAKASGPDDLLAKIACCAASALVADTVIIAASPERQHPLAGVVAFARGDHSEPLPGGPDGWRSNLRLWTSIPVVVGGSEIGSIVLTSNRSDRVPPGWPDVIEGLVPLVAVGLLARRLATAAQRRVSDLERDIEAAAPLARSSGIVAGLAGLSVADAATRITRFAEHRRQPPATVAQAIIDGTIPWMHIALAPPPRHQFTGMHEGCRPTPAPALSTRSSPVGVEAER